MNAKTSLILLACVACIADAIFAIIHKSEDAASAERPEPSSNPHVSRQRDGNRPSQPAEERNGDAVMQHSEREAMETFWLSNAAAGFATTQRNLIADLDLTDEEAAELTRVFDRRKEQLADLLGKDAMNEMETIRQICALLRNHGLREDLAGFLSPEKLATFDAIEAARERETHEARAYRDMAEINEVVLLTDAQKPQVLAALITNAPAKVEYEANARAMMSLHYGPITNHIDSTVIRGLSNMLGTMSDDEAPAFESAGRLNEAWAREQKSRRIEGELNALRDVLDERQLTRYREHLETALPW